MSLGAGKSASGGDDTGLLQSASPIPALFWVLYVPADDTRKRLGVNDLGLRESKAVHSFVAVETLGALRTTLKTPNLKLTQSNWASREEGSGEFFADRRCC